MTESPSGCSPLELVFHLQVLSLWRLGWAYIAHQPQLPLRSGSLPVSPLGLCAGFPSESLLGSYRLEPSSLLLFPWSDSKFWPRSPEDEALMTGISALIEEAQESFPTTSATWRHSKIPMNRNRALTRFRICQHLAHRLLSLQNCEK